MSCSSHSVKAALSQRDYEVTTNESKKFCILGFGYNAFGQVYSKKVTGCDGMDCIDGSEIIDTPTKLDVSHSHELSKIESTQTTTFLLWRNGTVSVLGWVPGTKALGKSNDLLPGQTVKDISCTCDKVMLVTKAGQLLSWRNFIDDKSSSTTVKIDQPVSMVTCGDVQTLAVTEDGYFGHVHANDSTTMDLVFQPISFAHHIQSVSCGKEHVVLLTDDGTVFSFGGGSRGQLGNGSLDGHKDPKVIEALEGIEITAISCGGWHSAVISSTCDLYLWGWNKDGQVGVSDSENNIPGTKQGTVQIQAFPVPVVMDDTSNKEEQVVTVSCGSRHTAAITSTGEVWTWGWGFYGQLGHGNRESSLKPVKLLSTSKSVISVHCSNWNTFISMKLD